MHVQARVKVKDFFSIKVRSGQYESASPLFPSWLSYSNAKPCMTTGSTTAFAQNTETSALGRYSCVPPSQL